MENCFKIRDTNILVYLIVAMFGVGSWVAINGLWVELPVMVPHLPEGWKLPSYLVVITQIANVGPIIVLLLSVFAKDKINERVIIYFIVFIGIVSSLLLAFLWDKTSYIAGAEHSTALLVLEFFLASVDCTSSVLYLPYMALFKSQYMVAYFIGEGLSGLIPSLVALGQGVGRMKCTNVSVTNATTNMTHFETQAVYHDPSFPAEHFFYFLTAMMVMCGVAFTLLNYLPLCKNEYACSVETYLKTDTDDNDSHELADSTNAHPSSYSETSIAGRSNSKLISKDPQKETNSSLPDVTNLKTKLSRDVFIYFIILTAIINAVGNGMLPSIQTYSCLPYGNEAYHLVATLTNIANPVACFATFLIPVTSTLVISMTSCSGLAIAGFLIFLAVESPTPILVDSDAGAPVAITAWVLVVFILTFTKVSIASVFRTEGKSALLWCGVSQQVGSFIGAIILYVLVNVVVLFQSGPSCPT